MLLGVLEAEPLRCKPPTVVDVSISMGKRRGYGASAPLGELEVR